MKADISTLHKPDILILRRHGDSRRQSSLTCLLAPPKMSAKYRIALRSDPWFAALIGEPISLSSLAA